MACFVFQGSDFPTKSLADLSARELLRVGGPFPGSDGPVRRTVRSGVGRLFPGSDGLLGSDGSVWGWAIRSGSGEFLPGSGERRPMGYDSAALFYVPKNWFSAAYTLFVIILIESDSMSFCNEPMSTLFLLKIV